MPTTDNDGRTADTTMRVPTQLVERIASLKPHRTMAHYEFVGELLDEYEESQ